MKDMKTRLSMLWIFAMFNYLYADVITLMDPATLKAIIAGNVGVVPMNQGFLLGAAILMETAIAMVPLSLILKYGVNRWANIIIGVLHTAAVLASLFVGGTMPALYYLFFATIEILCTSFVVWCAWRWKPATTPTIGS